MVSNVVEKFQDQTKTLMDGEMFRNKRKKSTKEADMEWPWEKPGKSVPSKSNIKILSGMREKLSISKSSDSSYEMRTENMGFDAGTTSSRRIVA